MSELLICVDRSDFPAEISNPEILLLQSPVVLNGPTEILHREKVTILNSRQSPRFSKQDPWILKTLEALKSLDPSSTAIVSSLGTVAWEFLTWAAGNLGFPIILVFPAGSAQGFKIARTRAQVNFNLEASKTIAIRPLLLKKYRSKAEINGLRDNWIMALAEKLLPVSIKPKGNLDKLLQGIAPGIVSRMFLTPYESAKPYRKPRIPECIQLPEWYYPDEFLIHWTRSCVGPWPDETQAEYFGRRISSSEEEKSGLSTILRIIGEGCIRASDRMIRGKYPVVPFTERPPTELRDLIKWRAGLRRWTFEPYGIALRKSKLIEMGVRPVIYGTIGDFEALPEGDKPFFQIIGEGKQDWRKEKEWRIVGDISLDAFDEDELVVIVPNKNDAATIHNETVYSVLVISERIV